MKEQLVYHNGAYWSWWGLRDHDGRLCLIDLKDSSGGRGAKPEDCRIVEGEEYNRQMEAIEWFRRTPFHPEIT